MKLRILVYGINYLPELTGIGKYTGEMCEWLAQQGHQVEVITAMPYYPEWKIHKNFRKLRWFTRVHNGVKIHRVPLYVPNNVNTSGRIISEITFLISSFFYWFISFFKSHDIVIVICPPLLTGIFPMLYQLIKRKSFIFHIQDLQVDTAKELGLIKNSIVLKLLIFLELLILKNATFITSISEGMKKKLLQKGISENRLGLLPNWVDTNFVVPLNKSESLKTKMGFNSNDKIILYSGNMGEKQGLEIIIDIAKKCYGIKNLYFVLVGEGGIKTKLQQLSEDEKLNNIKFFTLFPYKDIPELLSIADIHLVLQKKASSDLVMPSKLTTIFAAGGTAIVSAEKNSSLYNEIIFHQIAIVIEPENVEVLHSAILNSIQENNSLIKENAVNYARKFLDKKIILTNFEKKLLKISSFKN